MATQNYAALWNVLAQTATYPDLDGATAHEASDWLNETVEKRDPPPDGDVVTQRSLLTERGLHSVLGAAKASAVMQFIKDAGDGGDAVMASAFRMLTQISDGAGIDVDNADVRAQIAGLQALGQLDAADVIKLDEATHVRGPRWSVWFDLPTSVRPAHVSEARRIYG